MCVHTHTHTHTHTYTRIHIHTYIHTYIRTYIHTAFHLEHCAMTEGKTWKKAQLQKGPKTGGGTKCQNSSTKCQNSTLPIGRKMLGVPPQKNKTKHKKNTGNQQEHLPLLNEQELAWRPTPQKTKKNKNTCPCWMRDSCMTSHISSPVLPGLRMRVEGLGFRVWAF